MQTRAKKMQLIVLLAILFFSGCAPKEVVIVQKPKKPNIVDANITQCKNSDILENTKCVLNNYLEVKQERDSLRVWELEVSE